MVLKLIETIVDMSGILYSGEYCTVTKGNVLAKLPGGTSLPQLPLYNVDTEPTLVDTIDAKDTSSMMRLTFIE